MSLPQPNEQSAQSNPLFRGQWKWGLTFLAIACTSQAALWARWWEDPTYFKMSVLFVWPAAIFILSIWWIFFSGWSWRVRLGLVALVLASLFAFNQTYRMEWDGSMVPRRFVLRSKPTGEEIARQYLKQRSATASANTESTTEQAVEPTVLVASEGDWPGFRGPNRDGIVQGGSLRRNWETAPPRELWRHPLGRAWSSFAVVGNYAFTQEQRDENECVVAYDLNTGAERWVHEDKAILSIIEAQGGSGPHATPQFQDGMLYTLGGTGILNCLDAASGKSVWSTNILNDASGGKSLPKNIEWGMSGSPLLVDNLVIVVPGGTEQEGGIGYKKGVAAYDAKSGQLVWTGGIHQASYGSPRVETLGGVRQLLVTHAHGLSGYALDGPNRGDELWFFPLENPPKVNSSMPWRVDDRSLLFGTGYGIGTALLEIQEAGGKWEIKRPWMSNRFRPKFNDFFVRDGFIYGLDDGILACMEVSSGTLKWRAGRYGYGQLLLVDDILLVISEDGDLVLVPATPSKPEPVATFKVLESGFCWNHPVLVGGKLLLRNAVEAVCYDVSAE